MHYITSRRPKGHRRPSIHLDLIYLAVQYNEKSAVSFRNDDRFFRRKKIKMKGLKMSFLMMENLQPRGTRRKSS